MGDGQRDERGRHREKRGDRHIKRWYQTQKMGNRERERREETGTEKRRDRQTKR